MKKILAMLALTLLSTSGLADQPSFSTMKSRALAMFQNPSIRSFIENTYQNEFMEAASCSLRQCFETLESPDSQSFEMVFEVAADGVLLQTHLNPMTDLAQCMAENICATQFTPYQQQDILFHEEINFAE